MKKTLSLITLLLISINLLAQAPQKMSYQAVIRDASNNLVTNAPVKMKISILQGSATGNAVYSELHSATTNANGLVSIEIGGGTNKTGTFSTIDWGNGTYFLKTETDPTNGNNLSIVGTSQLLSVPYALESKNASSAGDGIKNVSNDTLTLNNGDKYIIPGIKKIGNPPSTINNGLVGYWPFNGNANDESGNGRNGIANQVTWGIDRFGISNSTAEFNNVVQRYIRVDNPNVSPISELTFSYWLKVNNPLNYYNHIISTGSATDITSTGSIYCQLYGPNPGYVSSGIVGKLGFSGYLGVNNSQKKLDDGKWHNGIMIVDWVRGSVKIYIDGILDAAHNFTPQTPTVLNFIDFGQVYNNFAAPDLIFPGELDDIRIYNRALTQEEITYLANN